MFGDIGNAVSGGLLGGLTGVPGGGLAGTVLGGKKVGQLLGVVAPDQPDQLQPQLSGEASDAIQQQQKYIDQQTPEKFMEQSGLNQDASQTLGYGADEKALNRRAARAFENQAGQLKEQTKLMSHGQSVKAAQRGFDISNELEAARNNARYQKAQADLAMEQSRSQALSAIFGGVGSAAGSIAGTYGPNKAPGKKKPMEVEQGYGP